MKKILLKNVGIGFLMLIAFNIVLFVISMPFGFEDSGTGPTLVPATIFALIMGLIVYFVVKKIKPVSSKEAYIYSISWTAIVLILTLITTVANDTTNIFFGDWFNYLVFVTMAVSPVLLKFKNDNK